MHSATRDEFGSRGGTSIFMARRPVFSPNVHHSPYFGSRKYITGRRVYLTAPKNYITGRKKCITKPDLPQYRKKYHRSTWFIP